MIAKILIKRRFKNGHQRQIYALLNELRALAMTHPGYISGETLSRSDFPNNLVVIATWQTMDAWHAWQESQDRQKFEAMLSMYQERPTEYDEYYLGTPPLQKSDFDK
jgi:antibiotic biosynthesis monooxygenase (ABM) superfamily enzyme